MAGMVMDTTRDDGAQQSMWVSAADLPRGGGHPFCDLLNRIFEAAGFDALVEGLCAQLYATKTGRPGLAPERCFRLLLPGGFRGAGFGACDRVAGGRFPEHADVSALDAAGEGREDEGRQHPAWPTGGARCCRGIELASHMPTRVQEDSRV